MIELWLVVSTVCFYTTFGPSALVTMVNNYNQEVNIKEPACVESVKFYNSFPEDIHDRDTVYKVMPDGYVAIPKKVWKRIWRTYDDKDFDFSKMLDEIERLEKLSFNPQTPEFTRRVIGDQIRRLRTEIQETALDKKVGELETCREQLRSFTNLGTKTDENLKTYFPHIHQWKDYQEIVNWTAKCYCGKKRRKINVEKWVEE